MKSIRDIDLKGKKVLLRTNFDVPLKGGKVFDDARIKEAIPTIRFLLARGAKVAIITHLGRPKGKDRTLSVSPVVSKLKKLLNKNIVLENDILSVDISKKLELLDKNKIIVFENIRFWPEEEQNNFNFAKQIASNFDVYINEAFPVNHRAHATIEAITRYIPSYPGFALLSEVSGLSKAKDNPHHPFVVVIGGIKVSDKIDAILNLAKKADYILIGGGIANTFLVEHGYKLGSSFYEKEAIGLAKDILKKVGSKIVLPIDVVCANNIKSQKTETVDINSIPSQICQAPYSIYDIGPKTLIKWEDIIKTAKTVFWAGPLGAFEYPAFSNGTKKVARMISKITGENHETIVGGGDTTLALNTFNIKKFTHISTAGSAMLEFIAGKKLPGIDALERKN
ncbi:phosphoglycerate kinase [bacterium]|nr:phosphoglycerate kinase [bacterium]